MSEDAPVVPAAAGDRIVKGDLQPSADELIAIADALNPDIEQAQTPQQLARLMQASGDLLAQARKLIEADIALITGEARVSADQVRAALTESRKVIAAVASAKSRLAKVGAVLDFVATVATGSGTKIFQAAHTLKNALSAA